MSHPCPTRPTLQQFSLGEISDVEALHVEAHLAHCNSCKDTLGAIQSDDTWVAALRAQAARPDDEEEPQADLLMRRFSSLWMTTAHAADSAEQDLAEASQHWSPPRGEGEIGWIGPFRLLNVLGIGGMGIVLKADDRSLQRQVAIKVMRPRLAAVENAKQRFLREAQATAAIQNDHVIAIYQVGEENGIAYFAMPFLQGETLEAALARERLSGNDLLRIAREIAGGMAAAHARGVIHRDIKPANIFLAQSDHAGDPPRVKILDFGLAQARRDDPRVTSSGYLAGTPHYMSPEQARGEVVDERSDLFSLGCVLYHAATGRPPFAGSDTLNTLSALATETPVPISTLNPAVPTGLSEIVAKLLEKDPAQRFSSARDVATALQRGDAALGRSMTWRTWMFGAAAALCIALAGALYTYQKQRPGEPVKKELDRVSAELAAYARSADAGLPSDPAAADVAGLRAEMLAFAAQHRGKPAALEAARQMSKLAWPADALNRASISEDELRIAGEGQASQSPAELVAIFGSGRFGHWHMVNSVAVSADGKLVASAGQNDHSVRVWNDQGRLVQAFPGCNREFWSVAISPDKKIVAGGSMDGTVPLWNIDTGERIKTIDAHPHSWVMEVLFDRSGERLITGGREGIVKVWSVATGEELKRFSGPREGILSLALARDDQLLIAGSFDRSAYVWDMAGMDPPREFKGNTHWVHHVAVTRDEKSLLTASRDGAIKRWNLDDPDQPAVTLQEKGPGVEALLALPDAETLLSCDGAGMIGVWDLKTGSLRRSWPGSVTGLRRMATDRSGTLLAAAGTNVKLWQLTSDDQRAVTSNNQALVVNAGWTADGSRLWSLSCEGTFRLWDLHDNGPIHTLEGLSGGANDVALSPSGQFLAAFRGKQTLELWDLPANKMVHSWDNLSSIRSVAYRPDGLIATGGGDGTVRLWNSASEQPSVQSTLLTGAANPIIALVFSPDDQSLAALSEDGTIGLWDLATSSRRTEFKLAVSGTTSLAYSPDGGLLATIDPGSNQIQLWDGQSGQARTTEFRLKHDQTVIAVAWGPEGDRIASTGLDGTVRIWEAKTGRQLNLIRLGVPPRNIYSVAFSPDGRHVATANGNGSTYVLRIPD